MKLQQSVTGIYFIRFDLGEQPEVRAWVERFAAHMMRKYPQIFGSNPSWPHGDPPRYQRYQRLVSRVYERFLPPFTWLRANRIPHETRLHGGRATVIFERYEDAFFFLLRWS